MTDCRLLELSRPAGPESQQSWAYLGYVLVDSAANMLASGEPAAGYRVGQVIADLNFTQDILCRIVVAVRDESEAPESVVGLAHIRLPLTDNLDSAEILVVVHPEYRGLGIGTQLLEWVENVAAEAGRHSWQSYCYGSLIPENTAVLQAPSGGAVPKSNPGIAFALKHGYALEQVERFSLLDVPMPVEKVSELLADARAHSTGYRIKHWIGRPDADSWRAFAVLRTRASVDAPIGGMDWEEVTYDADRVLRATDQAIAAGLSRIYSVAEHIETGELVAASYFDIPVDGVDYALQNYTIVLPTHYGHRLGLLVKMENYLKLRELHPEINRILTWNAEENGPMLRINEMMGFYPVAYHGCLQRSVTRSSDESVPTGI